MTQIDNTLIPSRSMFEFDNSPYSIEITSACHLTLQDTNLMVRNRHPIHRAVRNELNDNLVYGAWNNVKKWFRRRT